MPLESQTSLVEDSEVQNQTLIGMMHNVGDKMGVKIRGWRIHYPCTISALNKDGTVNLKMDDGSDEDNIDFANLIPWKEEQKRLDAAPALAKAAQEKKEEELAQAHVAQMEFASAIRNGGTVEYDAATGNFVAGDVSAERKKMYKEQEKYLPLYFLFTVGFVAVFSLLVYQSTLSSDAAQACDELCTINNIDTRTALVMSAITFFCLSFLSLVYFIKIASKGCWGIHTLKHLRLHFGFGGELAAEIIWYIMILYIGISFVLTPILSLYFMTGKDLTHFIKPGDGKRAGSPFRRLAFNQRTASNMTFCLTDGPCCERVLWTTWTTFIPGLLMIPLLCVCLKGMSPNTSILERAPGGVGRVLACWIACPFAILFFLGMQLYVVYTR